MKTFEHKVDAFVPQGDLGVWAIADVDVSTLKKKKVDGPIYIAAHSETGHHHTLDNKDIDVYETDNPLVAIVHVKKDTQLVNHRVDPTPHETILLTQGFYKLINQVETVGDLQRRVAD